MTAGSYRGACPHPSTLTRRAANTVIRTWSGGPGPMLVWAVGAVWCGSECLTAVWDHGPAAHPALHRERRELSGYGYSLVTDRTAARVRWWTGTETAVDWYDIAGVIGATPGPDLTVVAAAIRVLHEDLAAGHTRHGGTERDLRVLALEAWATLRPDAIRSSSDALFEVPA